MQWFGVDQKRFHHIIGASKFWGRRWMTKISSLLTQLEMLNDKHRTLLDRIPLVKDVQSAWLFLVHCASARANCVTRVVEPQTAEAFCRRHDVGLW